MIFPRQLSIAIETNSIDKEELEEFIDIAAEERNCEIDKSLSHAENAELLEELAMISEDNTENLREVVEILNIADKF